MLQLFAVARKCKHRNINGCRRFFQGGRVVVEGILRPHNVNQSSWGCFLSKTRCNTPVRLNLLPKTSIWLRSDLHYDFTGWEVVNSEIKLAAAIYCKAFSNFHNFEITYSPEVSCNSVAIVGATLRAVQQLLQH